METVANVLSLVIFIGLLVLIAPALWEVLCFCVSVIAQVALIYMIVAFFFAMLQEVFGERNEGQKAYSF